MFRGIWRLLWFGGGGDGTVPHPGGQVCGTVALSGRVAGTAALSGRIAGTVSLSGRMAGTAALEEC